MPYRLMAGLRAKQKAARERRILEAASKLFRERGFQEAKIERIAELAEVSVGTIYNYYKNKGDLLLAIVVLEVGVQIRGGHALISDPPRGMAKALQALTMVMLDNCTHYVSKEMWRHAMATSTRSPETPFGKSYNELDDKLAKNACDLMVRLQDNGHLRPDVDAYAAGELWFNSLNMMFTIFVKRDDMSLDDLKADVARQSAPLILALELS